MFKSCLICIVLLYTAYSQFICSSDDGSLVETNYGCIRGIIQNNGRSFTSIPYATPPTKENDLRFRNPIPANPWSDILDATSISPACMQRDCNQPGITCYKSADATMSEDCLYLNVYTPPFNTNNDNDLLPVMFWIHGGTYLRQWSGSPLYNPQTMAYLNNVIVVTINYRVGSFGFLYDPDNGFDGNYGYFDQLLALQFTYENIEYFGGDKTRIVLFGESAGASSVASLLMDTRNTMYSGAIMISPPLGLPFRTPKSWQQLPNKYYQYAGCDESDDIQTCIRSQTTSDQLLQAQNEAQSDMTSFCKFFNCYWIFSFMPWTPTFKTEGISTTQPLQAFMDEEYNKVEIIIGNNENEGVSFIYDLVAGIYNGSYEHGLCRSQYKALIYAIMGKDNGDKIIEYYKDQEPVQSSQNDDDDDDDDDVGCDYRMLLSKITTEFLFICPSRNSTISISKYSNVWKYHYNYLYLFDPPELYFGDNIYCQGVDDNICHGVGLPIIFQSETLKFDEDDIKLSAIIQSYFTNLAHYGEPDVNNKWKKFKRIIEWNMVFTDDGQDQRELRYEENNGFDCAFWDKLGYPQLWWQDSPFPSGDLLRIFANKTFIQQLNTDDKCNNECNNDDYTENGIVEYRGLGGMTFTVAQDSLLGNYNSLILLTIMALLMLFNTVMIFKFQFCGIKQRRKSTIQRDNEINDDSDGSEE